jgi:hypothetical protein
VKRPLIIFQVSSITRDGKLEIFKIHYTEVDMSRIVVTVVGKQAGETNFAGLLLAICVELCGSSHLTLLRRPWQGTRDYLEA